jgi:integrase/recombinase XerD
LLGVIGKSRKPRDIPFCDDVRKLLIRYIKARGEVPSLHFFLTLDGHSFGIRSVQAAIRKYGEAAGIKDVRSSPHTLRHTFAKLYIMNEGDPYNLQDILGHTSQDMVKKYVNLWKPEMRSKHAKSSPMRRLYKEKLLD